MTTLAEVEAVLAESEERGARLEALLAEIAERQAAVLAQLRDGQHWCGADDE